MKRLAVVLPAAIAALVLAFAGTYAHAAGYQRELAVDPDGKPIELAIWYPTAATPSPATMGPITMSVAPDAEVKGKDLPLIVISHGNGGSSLSHYDTAIALADAGFVVAAVTHTGDSYADQSRAFDVMDRPRHVSRAIDHMLLAWGGRAAIAPARIGIFGFSSGGFTALASIGGVPDFSTIGPMCARFPGDYVCQMMAKKGGSGSMRSAPATIGAMDARIKAAVVAAPALGFTFAGDGLKNVKGPAQLWRAENDTAVPHPRYAEIVRASLPQAPDYHLVSNAGHFDFLAPCSSALAAIAPAICTSADGFDRASFHSKFNGAVVEFFEKTLRGEGGKPAALVARNVSLALLLP